MDLIITSLFSLTAFAWWGTVAVIFFVSFLAFTVVRFLKGQTKLAISEAKKMAKISGFPIDVKLFPKIAKRLKRPKVDVKRLYNRLIEKLYVRGIWFIRCEMGPYLKKGETFLDVGSGSGYLAKELEKRTGVKVTCVDVVDSGKTEIPIVLFDGKKLPFSDQSFDTVMFSYVLHHAGHHQSELLKEAKRVAKKRVIVFEDEAVGGFGDLFTSFHGLAYDFLHDIKNNNSCVFHSAGEWEKIFKEMGFKILVKEVGWSIGSIVCPVKRSFFVLGV